MADAAIDDIAAKYGGVAASAPEQRSESSDAIAAKYGGVAVAANASSKNTEVPWYDRGSNRQMRVIGKALAPYAAAAGGGALLGGPPGALAATTAMGITHLVDKLSGNNAIDKTLEKIGFPTEESMTPVERVESGALNAVTGGGAVMAGGKLMQAAANPVIQGIGTTLAAAPGAQVAMNAAGGAFGDIARQAGANPFGQFIASLGASMAVPGLKGMLEGAARLALRGGEAGMTKLKTNISNAKEMGVTLPAATATENAVTEGLTGALGKLPGGSPAINAANEKTAQEMGAVVNRLANGLVRDATQTIAGNRIETGIQRFVTKFREVQNNLYNRLDTWVKPETPTNLNNFRTMLEKINPQDEVLQDVLGLVRGRKTADLQGLVEEALAGKLAGPSTPGKVIGANGQPLTSTPGTPAVPARESVPWQSAKQLRTAIGEKLDSVLGSDDIAKAQWKRLYGALSDDMRLTVDSAGPEAAAAYNRANSFTTAGHQRINDFLKNITSPAATEDMFKAAIRGTKDGASKIQAVMRSIEPAERQAVSAAFVKRMGWNGADQTAEGANFSLARFLTDWKNLDPKAKASLFGNHTGTMRTDLEMVANMAAKIQRVNAASANPSGTSRGMYLAGGLTAFAGAAATGNLGVAAGILGMIVSSNVGAKLMGSQPFVHWLAQSTHASPAMLPVLTNQLDEIAKRESDSSRQRAIREYKTQLQNQIKQ